MKTALIVITISATINVSHAGTLDTPSYKITIESRCPDYDLTCSNVKYVGVSKKTGKSITLIGKTLHAIGADGVTPSQFLGYTFKHGRTTYFAGENGEICVTRGSRVLIRERGAWTW